MQFSQLMGSLTEVHMPQNGINHPGVTALAKAMQHNTALHTLNLNDNTFSEEGGTAMAQVPRFQSSGSWNLFLVLTDKKPQLAAKQKLKLIVSFCNVVMMIILVNGSK